MIVLRPGDDGQGVHYRSWFCPGCKDEHTIPISGPKAWSFNGNEEKPTFWPSVLVYEVPITPDSVEGYRGQPRCHSFVTDGAMNFLADCTHSLAGQVVPIPPADSIVL